MQRIQPHNSFIDRLIGVATFKAPIYREIANDPRATGQAALVVVATSVVPGLLVGLIHAPSFVRAAQHSPNLPGIVDQADRAWVGLLGGVGAAVLLGCSFLLAALIGWFIGSWLTAWVVRRFFSDAVSTAAMLRVYGYTNIFLLLFFIGIVPAIIGGIIGLSAATNFDRRKAVLAYFTVACLQARKPRCFSPGRKRPASAASAHCQTRTSML